MTWREFAVLAAVTLVPVVSAQAGAWAQCGGNGFSGQTTCVSGYTCTKQNDYYSQCLPGSAPAPSSSRSTSPPRSTTLVTRTSAGGPSPPSPTATVGPVAGNPLAGYELYANPYYSSEIHTLAIPSLVSAGKTALAAKASAVAKVGTFVWLDTRAKVPSIPTYAEDVRAKNKAGANIALPLVVYNLPDRDCAALASNGELAIANNGEALYRGYIDSIAAHIKTYSDVKFILTIEPDSLANLITNLNVQKCANAKKAYEDSTIYALKTLNLPNVSMYLDGGHGGWLGWDANITPAAKMFGDLYKAAGSPKAVRGLVTNVSNYNGWSLATCPSYTTPNKNCDEKKFVNAFAPLLSAAGFPAHFLVDTGRNGVQPTKQIEQGHWCNVIGTGFGVRPTTNTGDPLVDAFVWVKPGGESDGTSDTTAVRYDAHCGEADALKPAPEAGAWFQAYFEQLLTNANPSF
ncbi:glycoside hydrolase family 6 protein [Patellaria atrata CBS 101060]|uniref:Glucanase n=1 Tax=Patellaria atrata CBS 101060 TaxID=1346257 RepID=A0A9P4S2Z3_9PEZI|nr:glycoside hydrolase family 6 protein [Patellaria atrata CBS 101060]